VESLIPTAFEEAKRFRHSVVLADHLLTAIAKDNNGSLGRAALAACGIDAAAATQHVASLRFDPPMPALRKGQQPSPNPHFYELLGRAEGFAYAAGSERPASEHVLLGLIWDDGRLITVLLEPLGRAPRDLVSALAELGVPVPVLPPPVG
jgi:ATP-dependent Clp protease ATP-binding subunit ClpA